MQVPRCRFVPEDLMQAILLMKSFACRGIAENVQEKIKVFCSKHLQTERMRPTPKEDRFSVPGITVASFYYCKMSNQKLFTLDVTD